jgi:Fe-S oxidoreductase
MLDVKTATDLCTFCPRLCSHTCPVSLAEARETVTPQAKMAQLGALLRHADAAAAPLYACTGCGACTEACVHGVEPGRHLLPGRARAEELSAGHPALHEVKQHHTQRARAATEAVRVACADRLTAAAPAAYLASCLGSPADEARAVLRVTDRLAEIRPEARLQIAAVESGCGGYPLWAAGLLPEFRLYAEVFARQVQELGTLVLSCPSCTYLMRTQYPAHGVPLRPRVEHLTEFLLPFAEALPVRRPVERAAYHDPCYLGRHLQLYDPPRALLSRAVEQVVEFPRRREEAACTGGGGLLPLTAPDTARAVAKGRLAELDPAAAPLVVTACASCRQQLGRAGAQVLDLIEVLDQATSG